MKYYNDSNTFLKLNDLSTVPSVSVAEKETNAEFHFHVTDVTSNGCDAQGCKTIKWQLSLFSGTHLSHSTKLETLFNVNTG